MRSLITAGLPDSPMVDSPDLKKALSPIHIALNKLAQETGVATGQVSARKSELSGNISEFFRLNSLGMLVLESSVPVSYGLLLGVSNVGGVAKWILANSTTGVRPIAVCVEPGGAVPGELCRAVFGCGLLKNVAGVTAGNMYWVGTGGQFVNSKPAATFFSDPVAVGLDSETLAFQLNWKA